MQHRTLGHTTKNLILALLNASLILLALCLWLAWKLNGAISSTASTIVQSAASLEPLRQELRATTAELVSLRENLNEISGNPWEDHSVTIYSIQARVDALETRTSKVLTKAENTFSRPEVLIDYAIDQMSSTVKVGVQGVLRCQWD
ncbi:MAG: hypothetical protein ABJI96_20060 [Paracoccaceae bacterium]